MNDLNKICYDWTGVSKYPLLLFLSFQVGGKSHLKLTKPNRVSFKH